MERSESGQPIYRHKEREGDFEIAAGDSENIDRISDHIERHIGPIAGVFHEIVSPLVHIDIHVVEPAPNRNHYTLVTSGMSDRPMNTPAELPQCRYAELMLCLPPDWPMKREQWEDERNYWPIRLLKMLARLPHEYETWLGLMHTIPNGDPPQPYAAGTQLCGAILLPPVATGLDFHELIVGPEKSIAFYAIVPLHADEMELKLKKGAEALFDGFDEYNVSEILDPSRPSSLGSRTKPKKKWWPFGGN